MFSCTLRGTGSISGVVTTLYGYHILRYPTAEEAIPRLASSVQQLQMRTMDSTYFADLNTEFKIEVAPDAAAKMRAALEAIDAQRADKGKLVSYKGGRFTVGDFLHWTMSRITLAGAVFLAGIAIFPVILYRMMGVPFEVASFFGGTGLLIIVSVALDLVQKIDSHLVMRNYPGLLDSDK